MLHCWCTWNFEGMNVNNFFVEFRPTKHSAVKFERHKGENTAAPLLPYSNVSRIMKKKIVITQGRMIDITEIVRCPPICHWL